MEPLDNAGVLLLLLGPGWQVQDILHDSDLSSTVSPERPEGSPCVEPGGAAGSLSRGVSSVELCVRERPSLSLKKSENLKKLNWWMPVSRERGL